MKKIAMFIAFKGFRDEEYFVPKKILEAAGHKITAVSTEIGTAAGKLGGKAQTDCIISEINYKDYDAITLVGGPGALPELDNAAVHEIFRNAAADGKLIAAICISPMILAHAGLLKGRRATVWTDAEQGNIPDFKSCGAIYAGAAVEHDGKIITANGPAAAKSYAEEILKALAE